MFAAVELPAAIKQQVQETQHLLRTVLDGAQPGDLFRWTHADNLHLTLRFFGETSEAQRAQIEGALAGLASACPAFRLSLRALGAFPSLRKPHITWLDFGGQLQLLAPLQGQIERAARAAGYDAEERPFAPHLTIARAQKNASSAALARAGQVLVAQAAPLAVNTDPFVVEQIALIRSDLRPSGAVYRTLAVFPLAGGPA